MQSQVATRCLNTSVFFRKGSFFSHSQELQEAPDVVWTVARKVARAMMCAHKAHLCRAILVRDLCIGARWQESLTCAHRLCSKVLSNCAHTHTHTPHIYNAYIHTQALYAAARNGTQRSMRAFLPLNATHTCSVQSKHLHRRRRKQFPLKYRKLNAAFRQMWENTHEYRLAFLSCYSFFGIIFYFILILVLKRSNLKSTTYARVRLHASALAVSWILLYDFEKGGKENRSPSAYKITW